MNARAIELLTIKSESSIKSGKKRDISGKKEREIDKYWQDKSAKSRRKSTKISYDTFRREEFAEEHDLTYGIQQLTVLPATPEDILPEDILPSEPTADDDALEDDFNYDYDSNNQPRGDISIPMEDRFYYMKETFIAETKTIILGPWVFCHIDDTEVVEEPEQNN